jgi:hypothetical protein
MIKTFKKISIAAAALMMVACSSQDTAENRPAAGRQVQFTATIAAPNSATRTVYSEVTTGDAAGTIDVAWKAGDKIALIHNAVKDVVEVEAVNADGSATITGTITVGTDGEKVEVCYPAALWDWDNTTSGAIRNATTFDNKINAQDGTLGYIQDNLDARMGAGTLKVSGDKATLSANVTLESQIAIWKLNLQDNATPTPAALQATQVTVKVDGTTPVAIASTTTLGTATSTIYLGLDKFANQKIIIEATVGSDTYKYEKEGVSLELGKYYQSTVTMAPQGYAANEYNEGSWDSTNKKVVFTKQAAASVTAMTNTTTTWSAGWYTVSGNVTITGNVTLDADTHLILQDDATLTINGQLDCFSNHKNLYIYGQKKGDGKLIVTNNSDKAINSNSNLYIYIHGGEVTASAAGSYGLYTGYLAVYGGKLTATSGGSNGIHFQNTIDVYGGEVVATSNATSDAHYGIRSSGSNVTNQILTVYGGKVTATGNGKNGMADYGSGFSCYVKSGTSGIKFYFSADGTTWGDGTSYASATQVGTDDATKKRYAKAE